MHTGLDSFKHITSTLLIEANLLEYAILKTADKSFATKQDRSFDMISHLTRMTEQS